MPDKTLNILTKVTTVLAATCLVRIAVATAGSPCVQIFPQAVVQGDRIRLADLAGVAGLADEQARAVLATEICDAPSAGGFQRIDVETVRKALAGADVNLAGLCITGAAECRVFRPADPVSEPAVALSRAADADSPEAGKPAETGPPTLESAARNFLVGRLADLQGRVEVRFGAANRTALHLTGPDMTFAVRPRGNSPLGLTTLDVDVLQAGQVTRTIPVLAEVSLHKTVVVARRPVNRNAPIRAEDVSTEEKRFTRVEDIGLTNPGLAVNRQSRRYIDRGEMIDARDVQALPLVRRGEYVTVWFRRGGLVVRGSAKALAEGAQGDRIEVKAEPGGQVYPVVVTGLKTVEADSTPATLLSRAD